MCHVKSGQEIQAYFYGLKKDQEQVEPKDAKKGKNIRFEVRCVQTAVRISVLTEFINAISCFSDQMPFGHPV